MRRNTARLTPTKAPSPSAGPPSHARNPSRPESLLHISTINETSPSKGTSQHSPVLSQDASSDPQNNARRIEELKRQMEQTLANQQVQHQQHHDRPSNAGAEHNPQPVQASSPGNAPAINPKSLSPLDIASHATSHIGSSGSNSTIKGPGFGNRSPDIHLPKTPSYPFPVMPPRGQEAPETQLPTDAAQTTNSQVNEKSKRAASKAPGTIDMTTPLKTKTETQSTFVFPESSGVPDDPLYPSPNLYDLILKLNSEPGLESWWANVVDVLQTNYGIERASLAVPGDSTDLENLPWGQKATFNPGEFYYASDPAASSDAVTAFNEGATQEGNAPSKKEDVGSTPTQKNSKHLSSKRPSLLARHSFAGFSRDRKSVSTPLNAPGKSSFDISSAVPSDEKSVGSSTDSPLSNMLPVEDNAMKLGLDPSGLSVPAGASSMAIFNVPRDLEAENQPLVKQTGIVKLFGRSKPAVLTREYAYDLEAPSSYAIDPTIMKSPNDIIQTTPASEPPRLQAPDLVKEEGQTTVPPTQRSRSKSSALNPHVHQNKRDSLNLHSIPLYDEYEQAPSSPWSQSPAPSPAPRMHPEKNPFFTNHAVDEAAFAKDPPSHDYSQLEPVAAIGVDRSKSVVHVPLLHATNTKVSTSEMIRFPMAVLSFLSPIVPYPANLRSSLMYLMPHLTSSYSLAHQYTQLERQLAPGVHKPRFGHILGLGGTFSDASSELELVAGLSGQAITDGGSVSARASISSPDEVSNNPKFSPAMSVLGTPGIELVNTGSASEPSVTPAMGPGVDPADGYFNLHQARSSVGPSVTRPRGSKPKQGFLPSMPASPGVSRSKSVREDDRSGRESQTADQIHESMRPPPAPIPTRTSSRNTSTTSVIAHLQREGVSISEHIFQLMLNSVPLHLFLAKAPSGEVIWTNSKFDAYRRTQPQDQAIRDHWQNIHPDEVDSISKQWSKALQTGAQFTERVRVKRFNDENAYRWFIFRANPLLSQTGQVISWIGSFLDIHEQHVSELRAAQEREVFATNAKYRALANSIPQIVFEATELRGLISANEQWQLYTGQQTGEAMNYGFTSYVHPDDLRKCGVLSSGISAVKPTATEGLAASEAQLNTEFPKLFAGGITPGLTELVSQGIVNAQKDENGRIFYTTELRLRSRGGDYRWHLVRLIKVETGNFGDGEASWYGTCTDINDRKILERELNKAMQKLNREMESKTKFFSNMSHEIRTPLNGILGTIPFILDTQLDNEQRRMLDTIQNSSTNLRELVDNILDVSRVEAGKMNIVKSWFHLRSVLEDVIDTIASRAIDKGLEINYLVDTDVPDMVVGDRFRIRQVLINLMGNAVKFTGQGEIYTRCSIYRQHQVPVRETELFLNFEVVDTGKGFSAADAERLMQRFSQLGGNTSQQNTGSGLGLFLSKQLVEMHGGKLTPSSREGQGAKFSFYIKVDAPPQVPDPALTRQPSDLSDAPTAASSQGSTQLRIPLLPKTSSESRILTLQDLSPALDASPLVEAPSAADNFALRSGLHYRSDSSASAITTPEFLAPIETSAKGSPSRLQESSIIETSESNETVLQTPTVEKALGSGYLPPVIYSVLIICPLDHAREAVRQHIEQVIPLEVPATSTALSDIEDWKDLKETSPSLLFSHIVLNVPGTDEIMEALQHVPASYMKTKPSIVIICDLFQKRQISNKIDELISFGFKVDTIPKPVKPSAFSSIFDPDSRRDLSKDRNQDMAREVNNNFKTMTKMVKEVIGNKGYRILLVEDDETNRGVMLKYLDKVKVVSETAGHGQECLDMVFAHEPGYYSLIICDIQMPIKNGYETCQEIRAWEAKNHFHQIPMMALSANAMTDQIDIAARSGFNDYVTKPIKHNELGKMMMTLLDPNTPQILLRDRKDWQQQKA